jgi:hypothetical protein
MDGFQGYAYAVHIHGCYMVGGLRLSDMQAKGGIEVEVEEMLCAYEEK